jgi:Glycosyltransferase family 87
MERIPITTGLIVVGMCAFWAAMGSQTLAGARSHDFLNIYSGASLALDGRFADLHDVDVQLEREHRIFPTLPTLVPFVRPAFYAAILAPLALLSYNTAFVVWISLQSALLIACWIYGWWKFGANALVFGSMFLPAPLGIATGQDCVVLLALLIVSFELAERNRLFASGVALALMLVKFHLILLWPVALLLNRRWRTLAGFCAMAVVEVTISLALGGIRGAETYVALLRNKSLDRLSPSPELMISQQGFTTNLDISAPWAIGMIVAMVIVIFAIAVCNAPLWRVFALASVASLIVVPHVYGYDAALLMLPIWLVIFRSKWTASKFTATMLSTPIPFGMALAGKPYAITASAALLIFLLLLAREAFAERERVTFGWNP